MKMISMQTKKSNRTKWILSIYILLFGISIPWYLPKGKTPPIWFGLPHWVVISLCATLAVAIFTVFVIRYHWDEIESDEEGN